MKFEFFFKVLSFVILVTITYFLASVISAPHHHPCHFGEDPYDGDWNTDCRNNSHPTSASFTWPKVVYRQWHRIE